MIWHLSAQTRRTPTAECSEILPLIYLATDISEKEVSASRRVADSGGTPLPAIYEMNEVYGCYRLMYRKTEDNIEAVRLHLSPFTTNSL